MLQVESYIPDILGSPDCVDYMSDHFGAKEDGHAYWNCTPVIRTGELYIYSSYRFKRKDNGTPLYNLTNIDNDHRRYKITSQCCPEDSDENLKLLFLLYSSGDISLLIEDSDNVISRRNGEWFADSTPINSDPFFLYSDGWYVSFSYRYFMDCICHRVTNFTVEEVSSLDSLEAII